MPASRHSVVRHPCLAVALPCLALPALDDESQSVRSPCHAPVPTVPPPSSSQAAMPWAGMDEVVLGAASLPRAGKPRFTHPGPSFPASHPTVPSGRYWHRVRFALLLLWHCFGMAPPSLAPAVPPSVVPSVYINSSRPPLRLVCGTIPFISLHQLATICLISAPLFC